jgi:hypothetical protein
MTILSAILQLSVLQVVGTAAGLLGRISLAR